MPMIDYLCECGNRFEMFYHSNPPEEQACNDCEEGGIAKRILSMPGEYRPKNARPFEPIVVWINNEDPNKFSMANTNEPVQDGYHAVTINNSREADHFTRGVNAYEREKGQFMREQEKQYFDERLKEQRADRAAKIGSNPRMLALSKEIRERIDAKRAKKYTKPMDPKAHFNIIDYDSSNREGYRGEETGWKEKRS
jgi:hypothetical protein